MYNMIQTSFEVHKEKYRNNCLLHLTCVENASVHQATTEN